MAWTRDAGSGQGSVVADALDRVVLKLPKTARMQNTLGTRSAPYPCGQLRLALGERLPFATADALQPDPERLRQQTAQRQSKRRAFRVAAHVIPHTLAKVLPARWLAVHRVGGR